MVGVIGIIVSLGLLMYLAYRGISVLILAPILALFAASFSGMPLIATYTQVFMPNLANYLKLYFPVFMLGAIFGKVMEDSGSAKAIAHAIATKLGKDKAILAVVLTCGVLTYGGVSLFVVVFAVYPIAAHLFREAGTPKRLIPGAIALGSFTFTMTALPGTPQIQNAIPMTFFKTTVYAAPVLGIISAIIMFGAGTWWLMARAKKLNAKGEGYGDHQNEKIKEFDGSNLPSVFIALIPILIVLVLNYIIVTFIYTANNAAYEFLKAKPFETNLNSVRGNWGLIIALIAGIIVAIAVNYKRFKVKETVNAGVIRLDASHPQHRERSRLRQRREDALRLRHRPGRASRHFRQPAHHRGPGYERARRNHGFRLRWHEHRPGRDGRDLLQPGHRQRASTPKYCTASWRSPAAASTACRITARSSPCSASPSITHTARLRRHRHGLRGNPGLPPVSSP